MAAPAVYADECIDRPVLDALRVRGFDLVHAVEVGQAGKSDDSQLDWAAANGRLLLSYNRRHFRAAHQRWVEEGRSHLGVLVIPQGSPEDRRVLRTAMMLDWIGAMERADVVEHFFQWNDLQHLIHGGLILPGYSESETAAALGRD